MANGGSEIGQSSVLGVSCAKHFTVGDRVRFGASRVMTVTATVDNYGPVVAQKLTLAGPRGGIATAFVHIDGRVMRMA